MKFFVDPCAEVARLDEDLQCVVPVSCFGQRKRRTCGELGPVRSEAPQRIEVQSGKNVAAPEQRQRRAQVPERTVHPFRLRAILFAQRAEYGVEVRTKPEW